MKHDFNKEALSKVIRHLALAELRRTKAIKSDQTVTLLKRYFPVHVHKPQIVIRKAGPAALSKPTISQMPPPVIQRPIAPVTNAQAEISSAISFGKLSSLISDKSVNMIECPGHDMQVKFRKNTEMLTSNIILTSQEIQQIISSFSKESKTPVSTVFRAAAQGFTMTAIVSASGSRFMVYRAS